MAWLFGERSRGPQWKQGWKGETLSLPPLPLLAIFAIVTLFLSISSYSSYKAKMEQTEISLRFLLLFVPVVLIFVAKNLFVDGRIAIRIPRLERQQAEAENASPWVVAAMVLVLLVAVSYQSSFRSKWFLPLWWK